MHMVIAQNGKGDDWPTTSPDCSLKSRVQVKPCGPPPCISGAPDLHQKSAASLREVHLLIC